MEYALRPGHGDDPIRAIEVEKIEAACRAQHRSFKSPVDKKSPTATSEKTANIIAVTSSLWMTGETAAIFFQQQRNLKHLTSLAIAIGETRGPELLENCGVYATLSAIGQKYRREIEFRCQQIPRTCAYFFSDRNDSIFFRGRENYG
jgi:hypothetical protein